MSDGPTHPSSSVLLLLEGVHKSYQEGDRRQPRRRVVLDGVDAVFERGRVTAVLGRSGSGKSTLLNLVSGIDRADAGRIVFDGVDVTAMGERARALHRRARVGFVFQFFNLLPTLSVSENLLLPLELLGRPRAAARARVAGLLARIGMADRAEEFPDRLSGGEQQRIAVARALVHEPDLVLADEPTGNLDERTGRDILDLLISSSRGAGHTLVMVTHSREAAGRADRVLAMEGGRLLEPHDWP